MAPAKLSGTRLELRSETVTDLGYASDSSLVYCTTVRSLGHLQSLSPSHLQSLLAIISFQANMWSAEYPRSARNAVAIQCSAGRGVMIQPNNTGTSRAAVVNVSISVLLCIPPWVM